jgi:cytochrome o ubiquinol oxidase subunit 1
MSALLGKLSWDALPYDPIVIATLSVVAVLGCVIAFLVVKNKLLGVLWHDWLTSVDHKRIGIMYIILAFVMLLRGFADAVMMRLQLALATSGDSGYLPPSHYDQVFTAHGVIMIIFMAMPFMTGLMNIVVPLQIGARDVAFPFLNSLSFWLTFAGAMLVNISLGLGEFAMTGWVAYPPLSGLDYSPGVGVDYYIWSLQIAGIGTTLTAVNFLVTVFKMRAPGMKLMDMPIFTWTCTWANILIAASFPILTAVLGMLTLDRYLDFHFFTNDGPWCGRPLRFPFLDSSYGCITSLLWVPARMLMPSLA